MLKFIVLASVLVAAVWAAHQPCSTNADCTFANTNCHHNDMPECQHHHNGMECHCAAAHAHGFCITNADCTVANTNCHHNEVRECQHHHNGMQCHCAHPHLTECVDLAGCAGVSCPANETVICAHDPIHVSHHHCFCT